MLSELVRQFSDVAGTLGPVGFMRLRKLITAGAMLSCDFDGLLVPNGRSMNDRLKKAVWAARKTNEICVVTARTTPYVLKEIGADVFSAVVCECNLDLVLPNGEISELVDVPSMAALQRDIFLFLKRTETHAPVTIKRGGFTIDLRKVYLSQKQVLMAMMQLIGEERGFRVVLTEECVDMTLPEHIQSKALGLAVLKNRFPDIPVIAAARCAATDGPMFKMADFGLFVEPDENCALVTGWPDNFVCVQNPDMMVRILEMIPVVRNLN